jgi:hypothetical protein
MIFTGYNQLFFAVTTFTAAHFKILATILRNYSKSILIPDITQDKELASTDSESMKVCLKSEHSMEEWKGI